jgi:hypothetical protein
VRFSIARGVSVLVKVDARSRMSIVQALETALTEARTRPDLAPPTDAAKVRPDNARTKSHPEPTTSQPDLIDPDSVVLRRRIKDLAREIAGKNLLRRSCGKKRFGRWLRRLSDVQLPSSFAGLIVELESNVNYAKCDLGPWKARRPVWRQECMTAKNLRQVRELLAELAEALQVG